MSKTDPINIANPAGTSDPKNGDDYIRTLARAVVEILQKDHYVGAATDNAYNEDAAGEHSKITLNAPLADHPTNVANKAHLYSKDVDGVAELFFQDENGKSIQLTRYLADLTSKVQSLNADVLTLSNNTYLKALNPDGTSTVDLIKAGLNETGDTCVPLIADGARLASDAAPVDDTSIPNKKYTDDQIALYARKLGSAVGKSTNTVYQATTDGFVIMLGGGVGDIAGYVDPPPRTNPVNQRGKASSVNMMCFPVAKDEYWKVTGNGTILWIPLSN
jgi:hypothetical protein